MNYRELGSTGLKVSVIGLGAAQLGSSRTEYAVRMVQRAVELGVNYFDTARGYSDSEVKLGLGLKGCREKVCISSKTGGRTKEEAWQHIRESLQRLQTDYLDNYHLHGLRDAGDVEARVRPGGPLEALIEAREQGLIHHIGCTSHSSRTLIKALESFDFETILVPMNLVEREASEELLPLCERRGVGVAIMKPVATGLLPARLALKWLLNQPISTAVPGATTFGQVEENSLVGHLGDFTLTNGEEADVAHLRDELERVRCRICWACEPCPVGIPIGLALGTDVPYDDYRVMGRDEFKAHPWDPERVRNDPIRRVKLVSSIRSCTECGDCERKCPYGLPVIKLLRSMIEPIEDILKVWEDVKERAG